MTQLTQDEFTQLCLSYASNASGNKWTRLMNRRKKAA